MADSLPVVFLGLRFGRILLDQMVRGESGPAVRAAGVCDLNRELAQSVGRELGLKVYEDLEEILADPEIPGVVVLTPPAGRSTLMLRCIASGKHVMTTKPFERESAAGEAVLAAAKERRCVVHLNSPSPEPPDLVVVRDWIQRYDLGRPVAARAEMLTSVREAADGSWYDDPQRCPLAPMFRLGIYAINDLVRIFGPARQVFSQGERLLTGRPTPDQAQLSLAFRDGGMASVLATFCCDDGSRYQNNLLLHCERGTIHRNLDPAMPWRPVENSGAQLSLVMGNGAERRLVETRQVAARSGAYQWDLFATAVRERRPLDDDACAAVVNGLRVVEAMGESERTGQPISW